MRRALVLAAALLALAGTPAHAHIRSSTGYSLIRQSGNTVHYRLAVENGPLAAAVGLQPTRTASRARCSARPRSRSPGKGWQSVALPSPVPLTKGTAYWIAVLGADGKLVVRDHAGDSSPSETLADGRLTALPPRWISGRRYQDGPLSAFAE